MREVKMFNLSKQIFATISLMFVACTTVNAASYSHDPYVSFDSLTNTTTIFLSPIFQGAYLGDNWELNHGIDNNKGEYHNADLTIGEDRNIFMIYDLNSFASFGLDWSRLLSVSLTTSHMVSWTSGTNYALTAWDVTTDVNDLLVPQTGRSDIFVDLQSGIKYSSADVDFDNAPQYELAFNSIGVNAVKMTSGLFAVGASINTLTDIHESAMFPDGSNSAWLSLTFTTPVPEADTCGMLLAGLGVITLFVRRRT
jgi:hypothetical protein